MRTDAAGETKCVAAAGSADTRNDVISYPVLAAESHAAAAKQFASRPQLRILQASGEVTETRPMDGM